MSDRQPSLVPDPRCAPAELFKVVWDLLVDLLGTAATATLLRRSLKRLAARQVADPGVTITRDRFNYRYDLPESWTMPGSDGIRWLGELLQELRPLLVELTGPVVIRRLNQNPQLIRCGLISNEESGS